MRGYPSGTTSCCAAPGEFLDNCSSLCETEPITEPMNPSAHPIEAAGRAGRYLLQYLNAVTDVVWSIEALPIGSSFPITRADGTHRAYLCTVVPTDSAETRMLGATVAASLALLATVEPHQPAPSALAKRSTSTALDGKLFAHFQPIIELSSGHVVAVETFARLQSGNAILLPEAFIDVFDTPEAMLGLFEHMLDAALQLLATERVRLPHLSATVKLDVMAIPDHGLVQLIERRLADSGIAPEWLTIELIERTAYMPHRAMIDELWRVSDLGVQLVLADSERCEEMMRRLPGIPIAGTKLSRRQVCKLTEIDADATAVRALIERMHNAAIEVIADGVETRAQTERLLQLGCRFGQGYLFAVPQPAETLADVLDMPLLAMS